MHIDIIGVPIDLGAGRRGVDMGPSAIRYAHLGRELKNMGHNFSDLGNLAVPIEEQCQVTEPKLKYIHCITPVLRQTSEIVSKSMQQGHFPLVIGGDHSIALGSIRGAARHKKLGVLWVDAHADFNTAETTPSGNIHGMPLAGLCGLGDPRLTKLCEERDPILRPQNIAIIGARDLDAGEKANLQKSGIMVFGMEQIDRIGMYKTMEKALDHITRDVEGLYLSFDMDSLDPRHAPGVGTSVAGGLTYREAHLACEMIAETGKLVGMDMVEVNPILDVQNQTAQLAVELIVSALGRRIWVD